MSWRRAIACVLAAQLSWGATSAAAEPPLVLREITLQELGFGDLTLTANRSEAELFFPVLRRHRAVRGGELALSVRHFGLFAGRRAFEIEADGRPVLRRELEGGEGAALFSRRLDMALARGEGLFLPVALRLTSAITEDRCVDERLNADQAVIERSSGLVLDLRFDEPPSIAELFHLAPRRARLVVPPEGWTRERVLAALSVASALARDGWTVAFAGAAAPIASPAEGVRAWQELTVYVDLRSDPAAEDGGRHLLSVTLRDGVPELAIRAPRSDPGRPLMLPEARAVAPLPASLVATGRIPPVGEPESVPLERLGISLVPRRFSDQYVWDFFIPPDFVPPLRRVFGLRLDFAAVGRSEDGEVAAWVQANDVIVAAQSFAPGERRRLAVRLPEGVDRGGLRIRVFLQRRQDAGSCRLAPSLLPGQLLPTSRIEFAAHDEPPTDFADLMHRSFDRVAVRLEEPFARSDLELAYAALQAAYRRGQTLIWTDDPRASGAPFVVVASQPEPDWATPVRRLGQDRLVLADRTRRVQLDIAEDGIAVAQLVRTEDGNAGIWVRSRLREPLASRPVFALGNVSVFDAQGFVFAASTERDRLIQIASPEQPSLWDLLQAYRAEAILALWALLTALVLVVTLRRARRRSR